MDRIKSVAPYAILLALFMAGFTISSGFWSSSNASLQQDLRHSQEELLKTKADLASAKADYGSASANGSHGASADIPLMELPPAASVDQAKIVLSPDEGQPLFGGELFISLVSIAFEGSPLHHLATATFGAPGKENLTVNKQEVGAVTIYKANRDYTIRLLETGTFNATYLVTREPLEAVKTTIDEHPSSSK